MKSLLTTLLLALFLSINTSFAAKVISGPMAGYSTMIEVGVWVQLDGTAEVKLLYWEKGNTKEKYSTGINTRKEEAYTARFVVDGLDPGKTYEYKVVVDNKALEEVNEFHTQMLWQWREDPPAFDIAVGSCSYINEEKYDRPGTPYGRSYQIFDHMAEANPDMTLWLGDNIYLREPDWSARSGYLHRYTHTRSTPEMQKLLKTGHHYAIWDDHDFGPNDADGSWLHKDWALESFEIFWMNPSVGVPGIDGINTAFRFNDVDFFFLDNRYHRTSHDTKEGMPQMFGKEQLDWLIEALKFSNAPFKMVAAGGQILNDVKIFENFAQFEEERKYLLKRLEEENIEGVIFLTGDRHHTELSKMTLGNGIDVYDLTVSPLTSGSHNAEDEGNSYRVTDTHLADQNYAIINVSGERKSRVMLVTIFDKGGNKIWDYTIKAN